MKVSKYKVIKSRISDSENPIKLIVGESVKCIEESDPNGDWADWILCENSSTQGWIPIQIVEVSGHVGIITEEYSAIEFDIAVGEIIESTKVLNGWIWGRKENSPDEAWAPLNHLLLIE